MVVSIVIDREERRDCWRYTCPAGHSRWEATPNGSYCKSCADHDWGRDEYFEAVWDRKTGERYRRGEVSICESRE